MKSYVFKVAVEPDKFEDDRDAWHTSCPALKGGHTLCHIREVDLAHLTPRCRDVGICFWLALILSSHHSALQGLSVRLPCALGRRHPPALLGKHGAALPAPRFTACCSQKKGTGRLSEPNGKLHDP